MDKDTISDEPTPENSEDNSTPSADAPDETPKVESEEVVADTASVKTEAAEAGDEKAEIASEKPKKTAAKKPKKKAAKEEAAPKEEESDETPVPAAPDQSPVDLSALQGFDFGTSWSESKPVSGERGRPDRRHGGSRPPRGNRPDRKDRRSFKPGGFRKAPRREEGDQSGRPYRPGQGQSRRPQHGRPEAPRKVVEISFYPEDHGFQALCKALRVSTITYELFDIARTILEKDERFYMIIRRVDPQGAPDEEASLYVSEADGIPFLHEEGANQHALSGCLDHFFAAETKEVEPPTGSFSTIRKCGFTGELLGPPNFHRIKKIMADHHASRLSNMPYAKFESRIESVTEEEVIAEWLEKMKTQITYTLKPEFGEVRSFEDGETARAFVKANLADKLVREVKSARVDGTQISQVSDRLLKANIEFAWERQKRFPLDTANLLRGRLRRQKFALYKKGSKGVSYVCAVKRRFREPNESFSQPIQDLLTFLDANPNIAVKDLAKKYLGFAAHAAEGEDPVELTQEQQEKHKAMTLDFQWLLKEGYIAEYSNGNIFANPPAGPGQGVVSKKADAAEADSTEKADVSEETPKAESVETPTVEDPKPEDVESTEKDADKASETAAEAGEDAKDQTAADGDDKPVDANVEEVEKVEEKSEANPLTEPEGAGDKEPEVAEEAPAEPTDTEAVKSEEEEAEPPVEPETKETEKEPIAETAEEESKTEVEASGDKEADAEGDEDPASTEDPETELKEPAKS